SDEKDPVILSPEEGEGSPDAETASAETLRSAQGDDYAEEPGYSVTLPSFHGPLDLLLHLIKKHEVDIYDIPIVLITEQFKAYLDAMVELDLDVAADYIYMAALL